MKTLKLIGAIVISALIFVGCEKEGDISPITASNQLAVELIKTSENTSKAMNYYNFPCLILLPPGEQGPPNKGTKCEVAAVSSCSEYTACTAISGGEVNSAFTSDEIDAWEDGDLVFEQSEAFVRDHYSFFEHLNNEGLSFHPDTILVRNGWD